MNAAVVDRSDVLSVTASLIFHFQLEIGRFLGGFASGVGWLFAISAAKPPSRPHATTEINARNSSIRLRAFSEPSGSSAQRAAPSDSFGTRGVRRAQWALRTWGSSERANITPAQKVMRYHVLRDQRLLRI
jgi:hypothetical protein